MNDEYPHFPEPEPCGSYLCDEDHDGRCWTCGELWPCTHEKSRKVRRTTWTITVPAPGKFINLNSRMHWAPKAQLTKAWRIAAYVAAKKARLPRGLQRIHVTAHVIKPNSREYDVHNLMPTLKAAIDGLVNDYGLIPDDTNKHLTGPDLRQGGRGEPGVTITITEEEA